MGEIDVIVHFWSNVVNKGCTCYLGSTVIGHARQKNILGHFISVLGFLISQICCIKVSVDGPNVTGLSSLNCTTTMQKMVWLSCFQEGLVAFTSGVIKQNLR